jgi:hypothetical protein
VCHGRRCGCGAYNVPVPRSRGQAAFVEPLARELATLGVKAWLDKWEIRPGDSLVRKLFDEGLAAVDAVIVVVPQYSAGKPWVRAGLDAAVVRRVTEETRLIPVRLDGAEMPAPLQMLVWHTAHRAGEGIRHAARVIADTIYGVDTSPPWWHPWHIPPRCESPASPQQTPRCSRP